MCRPLGIRVVSSTATVRKWQCVRTDTEAEFMQTGQSTRDVYVIPPYESRFRNMLCLLAVVEYNLVNSNSKCQKLSDDAFFELRPKAMTEIPLLFVLIKEGKLVLLVSKIGDDSFLTSTDEALRDFIISFNEKFKPGDVVHGPGTIRFYGTTISQDEDYSVSIHADDKLNKLEPYPISHSRRRQSDEKKNDLERKPFMSINVSIGWLVTNVSLYCSLY